MTSNSTTVGGHLDRLKELRTAKAVIIISGCGLVTVSTGYNLRGITGVWPVVTFIIPPLALAVASWLAHTIGTSTAAAKVVLFGAIAAAVACFSISSQHIYHRAIEDGATASHAIAQPAIIDGLAILLAIAFVVIVKQTQQARQGHAEAVAAAEAKAKTDRDEAERAKAAATAEVERAEADRKAKAKAKAEAVKAERSAKPTKAKATKANKAKAAELHQGGATQEVIAEALGVSVRQVRRYLTDLKEDTTSTNGASVLTGSG